METPHKEHSSTLRRSTRSAFLLLRKYNNLHCRLQNFESNRRGANSFEHQAHDIALGRLLRSFAKSTPRHLRWLITRTHLTLQTLVPKAVQYKISSAPHTGHSPRGADSRIRLRLNSSRQVTEQHFVALLVS